jgi:hypothetical protein
MIGVNGGTAERPRVLQPIDRQLFDQIAERDIREGLSYVFE